MGRLAQTLGLTNSPSQPTMNKGVPFVSQIGSSHENYGCGVAATLMLLRHIGRTDSFTATAKGLKVDVAPYRKWGQSGAGMGRGAYARDVTAYLSTLGVPHTLLADPSKTSVSKRVLRALLAGIPVMVGMNNKRAEWGEGGHWIVVEPSSVNKFTYLNSAISKAEMFRGEITWNKIARDWDGFAIAVTSDA